MEQTLFSAVENNPQTSDSDKLTPKILVVGVGGAGCNTINRLIRGGVPGENLIAINTDKKHLNIVSPQARRILIGASITRGLGAGGFPQIARKSAEGSRRELATAIEGTDLIFITAGMGGGTGTGAAPIIADIAKEQGALVVSLVTYPFKLERARLKKAQEGIEELRRSSDTLVLIDNNRLLEYAPNLPIERSFEIIDEITSRAVRGITDTICKPSLLNLDFADVRSVMQGGGVSMIAVGEGAGVERVEDVVKNTMHHRFLDIDYEGAKGALLHLTGGPELTIGEVNEVGERFTEAVDKNANVVLGARHDPSFSAKIEAITIFTGIKSDYILGGKKKEQEGNQDFIF